MNNHIMLYIYDERACKFWGASNKAIIPLALVEYEMAEAH